MVESGPALGNQQVVVVIFIIDVWSLRRQTASSIPDGRPQSNFSRLKVRLCLLDSRKHLPRVSSCYVDFAVFIPEGGRVIACEIEVNSIGPR